MTPWRAMPALLDGSNRPGGFPLLGLENADHLFIQRGVGCDAIRSPDCVVAGPRRVVPAGFADDRRDGGAVPRVHLRIEHDLRPARRDEHVAIDIAPPAADA